MNRELNKVVGSSTVIPEGEEPVIVSVNLRKTTTEIQRADILIVNPYYPSVRNIHLQPSAFIKEALLFYLLSKC
jgi:tRNA U54 and U55 pseudouridine synthase Pus10